MIVLVNFGSHTVYVGGQVSANHKELCNEYVCSSDFSTQTDCLGHLATTGVHKRSEEEILLQRLRMTGDLFQMNF